MCRRVLEKLGFRETGRVEPGSVYGHSLLSMRESCITPGDRHGACDVGLPTTQTWLAMGAQPR